MVFQGGKQSIVNLIEQLQSVLRALFALNGTGAGQRERAISVNNIIEQVLSQARNQEDGWYWFYDLVADEGEFFAVFGRDGRLYRAPVTVDGTTATMGQLQEVEVQYVPAQTRSFAISRDQATGRQRYTRIVSTSFLLRGALAEIDSTELYDSFIEHAERTGQYPIASLLHLGAAARIGQADFLTRDGFCYIESGLFDDTELARQVITGLIIDPDFWGTSIEFAPLQNRIETLAGIDVTIWTRGIHLSSDTLPEQQAAALFTTAMTRQLQVREQMTEEQRATLQRLGVAPAQIDTLAKQTRQVNDEEAQSRIARAAAAATDPAAAGVVVTGATDAADAGTDAADDTGPDEFELELTEEIVGQIAEQVRAGFAADATLVTRLAEQIVAAPAFQQAIQTALAPLANRATQIEARLQPLERDENQRVREVAQQLPAKIRVVPAGNRARSQAQPTIQVTANGQAYQLIEDDGPGEYQPTGVAQRFASRRRAAS